MYIEHDGCVSYFLSLANDEKKYVMVFTTFELMAMNDRETGRGLLF